MRGRLQRSYLLFLPPQKAPWCVLAILFGFAAVFGLFPARGFASQEFADTAPVYMEHGPTTITQPAVPGSHTALYRITQEAPFSIGADIETHAFVSQGYIRSTENNFLVRSSRGSFRFAEVGVNFSKALTERLGVGVQFFAQSLGEIGKFDVKADWFQLDYRMADWLGIRVGRIKVPVGLYNDISDIDAARVPILLPQSLYPAQNRELLLAQSGAELYGTVPLRQLGDLMYRLYGGALVLDITSDLASPVQIASVSAPYIAGGRLLWNVPVEGLIVGASLQALRLEATLVAPGLVTGPIDLEGPALQWVGSLEYTLGELQIAGEYSRWRIGQESSFPALFPETTVVSERMYGLASYRLTDWLQPGMYYSMLFPDISRRGVSAGRQGDLAATLRFDINRYWILKLEGHFMAGTAGLSPALNEGKPQSALEDRWGLFLVKTTAYF